MYKQEIAKYIRNNCVHTPTNSPYMLGKLPGTRYKTQFYMANLTTDAEMMDKVFFEFQSSMDFPEKFGLVAPEWSGIPIMSNFSTNLHKVWTSVPSLIVRNERKSYGKHNYLEGIPDKNTTYIIVNDIANSGNGYLHCYNVLASYGLNVHNEIFAILNKYSPNDPDYEYDRYLGKSHKIVSVCNREDVFKS